MYPNYSIAGEKRNLSDFSLLTLRWMVHEVPEICALGLLKKREEKRKKILVVSPLSLMLTLNSTKLLSRYTVAIPRTLPHQLHNPTRRLVMYVYRYGATHAVHVYMRLHRFHAE